MNFNQTQPNLPRLVAIVIPVYNEEKVLVELFHRLSTLIDNYSVYKWMVYLVDDGSTDQSRRLIFEKSKSDGRFTLVELSRNFGFQAALTAGLREAAEADAVITMDADLQDPPEIIPDLLAAWKTGAEVVRATRRTRSESGLRRLSFDLFHRLFRVVSDAPVEGNAGTFGLIGKSALEAVNSLPERHRFFPGLRSWVGFQTSEILYDRQERAAGEPQQTVSRLLKYAMDGIFSFSYLPLRLLTYAGVTISAFGFILGVFFIVRRILGIESAQTGFTTLVTLILFLGGGQLIGIGILGEYLGRIYDEVKNRPIYIVKRKTAS